MLRAFLVTGGLLLAATAQAQEVRCISRFNVTWGSPAAGTGQMTSSQTCVTGFASNAAQFSGFRVVQNPANGTLRTSTAGSGAPILKYTPKKGFSGADTFVIDITAATANRQTGQINPPATSRITYTINVMP